MIKIGKVILDVIPKQDKSYESCTDCIHSTDTYGMCVMRLCVHAIDCLKECYEPIPKRNKDEDSD